MINIQEKIQMSFAVPVESPSDYKHLELIQSCGVKSSLMHEVITLAF